MKEAVLDLESESGQVREIKVLQVENSRLKQLVAELSLDKTMLQDVFEKRVVNPHPCGLDRVIP